MLKRETKKRSMPSSPLEEVRFIEEYNNFRRSPLYHGEGVPHGNGGSVLVLPGLFGNDFYLSALRAWLRRIGHRPIASNIPWNVGCPKRLMGYAERAVANHRPPAEALAVVGHSRGGMLAKALTSKLAPKVSTLIVVGSPLGGLLSAGRAGMANYAAAMQSARSPQSMLFDANQTVMRLIDPNCKTPACDCEYTDNLFAPLPQNVQTTSIFSPSDPIVPAVASVLPFERVTNVPVESSHSGMMFNAEVLHQIAHALSKTSTATG